MGPLAGIKVIEFAGIGPAPFCGMLLSDLGAEVVRIDRKGSVGGNAALFDPDKDILNRGRKSVAVDLKQHEGVQAALALIEQADILLEGFRPGVMERLGLGPDTCLARNPRLVYGRMTGWGQFGPLAHTAGHDINYLGLSGALHAIGTPAQPVLPLNLVADFGGGAMLLVMGVLAAALEAKHSGQGQVVDAAMTDGSALLMAMTYTLKAMGQWRNQRASNLLDGGAPFYQPFACADGKWLAVGPIEGPFYQQMLDILGVAEDAPLRQQWATQTWATREQELKALFAQRSRDDWEQAFAGSDACVTPILDLDEAPQHPHNQARHTFVEAYGVMQPAPAPRFSRTPAQIQAAPCRAGAHSIDVLRDWGIAAETITHWQQASVI